MLVNLPFAMQTVLAYEGGYVNHPKDPGGATNKGVTQATYNAYLQKKGRALQSVRSITAAEVQDIYKSGYWDKVSGDTLDHGVDLVVFDYAINSGPSRALQGLYNSVGGPAADTVKKVCAGRRKFLQGLKTWSTFGVGWSRRVNDVEAKGLVLAAKGDNKSVKDTLEPEVKASETKVKVETAKVTTAVSATTAAPVVTVTTVPDVSVIPTWAYISLGALVVAGVVVTAIFVAKAIRENDRVKALKAAIEEHV